MRGESVRFTLRGAVREALWRRLTGAERQRLSERHARFFAAVTNWRSSEEYGYNYSLQEQIDWFLTEIANLTAARDRFATQSPDADGVMMLVHLSQLSHYSVQKREFSEPAFEYLTAYIAGSSQTAQFYYPALGTLSAITAHRHDAADALKWLDELVRCAATGDGRSIESFYIHLLMRSHHAGNDEDFDRIAESTLQSLNEDAAERGEGIQHLIAENLYARRRFADALEHNDYSLAFCRANGEPVKLSPALYLRGCILRGLKRNDEARACWNEAMELAEALPNPHIVANCLNGLATLCRESGALSEAKRHALEAVALFRTVGDVAAVHVANATLGDILRDKGDPDAARALYEPGLAFWREKNHARWIGIFEEKIAKVGIKGQ